jgi:hypothetical protein
MRADLQVWYSAAAGQTVRLPARAARHAGGPLTVLDLEATQALAQPSLSWLLPARHPAFVSGRGLGAYNLLHQATTALAYRRDLEQVPDLLVTANQLISQCRRAGGGTALTAECRQASATIRRGGCGPRLLAWISGWLAQERPSLLDRTVRRLFRTAAVRDIPSTRCTPAEADPRTFLGSSARPRPRVSARLDHLGRAMERACRDREPAWTVLESRYAVWTLAEVAAHAVAAVHSASGQAAPRVHRALFGPSPGFTASIVIKHLLAWSVAGNVRDACRIPRSLAIGDVAVIEPAGQLISYAGQFLDGNDPLEVLGEAMP